ncbi:MAG TPA: flagellar biosynthesis anti-sigma factor FlgM [Tissierellia bacterium]|nr:flagellar biosynthesis anti-sigma factor FlgM [Tissierellia bacterium]
MKINKTDNILGVFFNRKINKIDRHRNLNKEDKLEVSDTAKDYTIAMEKYYKLPDIRREKVEELKEKVKSGTYYVDGKRVAERIMETVDFDKRI